MNLDSPASRSFASRFGGAADVVASAPGRVNLLGEHTDYNDGFVLPIATPQRTHVALRRRDDGTVSAWSQSLGEFDSFTIGSELPRGSFIDYVMGVTRALREHAFDIFGFDAVITSNVPVGSGLSSSAALEVALLRGLAQLFELSLQDVAIARLAQWGENHVVGAPVGILDPMACHFADESTALFLDTRTLQMERVALPQDLELVVVDSGVSHSHSHGAYGTRRAECEAAARLLGVPMLRDIDESCMATIERLPPPLDGRARHVVTENARVLAGVAALKAGDSSRLGQLFYESHASMRDEFQVSVPEVDDLVERAKQHHAVVGARLTGGGFGGAVVCLVKCGSAALVGAELASGRTRLLIPGDHGS